MHLVFWSQTASGLRHVQSIRWNIKRSMGVRASGLLVADRKRSAPCQRGGGRSCGGSAIIWLQSYRFAVLLCAPRLDSGAPAVQALTFRLGVVPFRAERKQAR